MSVEGRAVDVVGGIVTCHETDMGGLDDVRGRIETLRVVMTVSAACTGKDDIMIIMITQEQNCT